MKPKYTILLGLLGVDFLLNLYAESIQNQTLIYLTKPLLMIILGLFFFLNMPKNTFGWGVLAALLFSFGGDVALMFGEEAPLYFIIGLGLFLIAHLCYVYGFIKYLSPNIGYVKQHPFLVLPFLLFWVGFNYYLWDNLKAEEMNIPVLVYSFAISLMAITALNLKTKLSKAAFTWLFLGVLLFMFSDTIIGLNKFKKEELNIPYHRIFIMCAYVIGQTCIVLGAIKTKNIK